MTYMQCMCPVVVLVLVLYCSVPSAGVMECTIWHTQSWDSTILYGAYTTHVTRVIVYGIPSHGVYCMVYTVLTTCVVTYSVWHTQ